jgi:hypothetical protein
VLGHQRIGGVAAFHRGRRLAAAGESRRAVGRSLVGHEGVGDIVHQCRHRHGVDRLQVEDDPRLEVVQHLGIGLVQMRGARVVGAMTITLLHRSDHTHTDQFWRGPDGNTRAGTTRKADQARPRLRR